MKKEEMEKIVRSYHDHIGYAEDHKGTRSKVKSNPTIVHNNPGAFTLNKASIIEERELSFYLDRVEIPASISEDSLGEILDSMFTNFKNNMFFTDVDLVSYGFQRPGYGAFVMELENPPERFEVRFCAQGFLK